MELINRASLEKEFLPGRIIQKAVGRDAPSLSGKMTMGFAFYSSASGPMNPHQHAEEIVYILNAKKGWVQTGDNEDQLLNRTPLQAGMILHFPPLEWHVFEYENVGYVDIIFFYGQVDKIRPEEME